MLLRISLVIAIVAGLATLYFSHIKVADKITAITSERDAAQTAQHTAEQQQQKAEKDRRQAKDELDKSTKELAENTATLQATSARLSEQEKRANQLGEDLTKITGERNDAQTELSVWKQLQVTPEQIKGFKEQIAKVDEERDRFADENKIMLRRNDELTTRLGVYEGKEVEIKMPPVVGKILAVDDKYDFVVLNVGGNQGLKQNGKLLVNRDGKLVAKVRITKVEPDRSIANIMPDWKQAEVMEGDQVVY